LSVAYRPSQTAAAGLLRAAQMNGFIIADLVTEETTLEDVFLQLTGKGEKEPDSTNGEGAPKELSGMTEIFEGL